MTKRQSPNTQSRIQRKKNAYVGAQFTWHKCTESDGKCDFSMIRLTGQHISLSLKWKTCIIFYSVFRVSLHHPACLRIYPLIHLMHCTLFHFAICMIQTSTLYYPVVIMAIMFWAHFLDLKSKIKAMITSSNRCLLMKLLHVFFQSQKNLTLPLCPWSLMHSVSPFVLWWWAMIKPLWKHMYEGMHTLFILEHTKTRKKASRTS